MTSLKSSLEQKRCYQKRCMANFMVKEKGELGELAMRPTNDLRRGIALMRQAKFLKI